MDLVSIFTSPEAWAALLTLTFLEIVLGVDNIIFISIAAGKLKDEEQKKATNVGLVLAMVMRIALLFGITWLIAMEKPWISFDAPWIKAGFSGQSVILILGGIFLLYKATTEIHHKLEGETPEEAEEMRTKKRGVGFRSVIIQITIINIVFSFDSILTAVGMTSGIEGALILMVIAVVLSVIIMMLFAYPIGRFVNNHPTIQMLGLAFLILIGFMLIAEGAHLAHLAIAGASVGEVPKGYLYFAIAFSLFVEFLNLRLRKKQHPVQLHGIGEQAVEEGIIEPVDVAH